MKKESQVKPFLVFLFCFVTVIFSIYAIINMAKPNTADIAKQKDFITKLNYIIQSPSNLTSKSLNDDLINKFGINKGIPKSDFSFNSEINELPPQKQDKLIREKLLVIQVQAILDLIGKQEASSEPLIFKIWFWFFGLLAWAASISGGLILKFWTNKYVIGWLSR